MFGSSSTTSSGPRRCRASGMSHDARADSGSFLGVLLCAVASRVAPAPAGADSGVRGRTGRRRRRSGRRSPARRGSAAGARRSPRRRCRGRRPCRSARCGRRPWAAAPGRAAGPPPGASRTCPDTWIATLASGRSMEKLATLLTTSRLISPARNASKSRWRSLTVVSPLITGASRRSAELVELVEVLPDDQRRLAAVLLDELLDDRGLGVGAATRAGSAPRARPWRRPAARASGRVTRTSTQSAGAM